jgi:long-chain acyl-CoA synthetase
MPIEPGPKLLRDWIARAAQRHPDKPWIVSADDGRTIPYRELDEAAGRIAAFLHGRGIGSNDRVALLANNSIEHLLCYFGVMAYGATICTVHVEMNRNQLDNIFARLKPSLVLHQDGLGLDDLLSAVAAPRLRLGRFDQPESRTFFAELAPQAPSDAQTTAGARGPRAWC